LDIQRIRNEVAQAKLRFAHVEAYPTISGGISVKAAFQTSAGNAYIVQVEFASYPTRSPQVVILKPALRVNTVHRYTNGTICYMLPAMWNPGRHDLTFVLGRIAKWLNKYEVWCVRGTWPGAQVAH
jgi:ubiquitin-protein ligase